jgi:hypothetical protein
MSDEQTPIMAASQAEIEAVAKKTWPLFNEHDAWDSDHNLIHKTRHRLNVKAILEAAARVREANRIKNCKHERKHGSGMIGGTVGDYFDWWCDDCGKTWRESPITTVATV